MARPIRHAASLEQIAAAEKMTVGAVNVCLGRALRKLRSSAGLLKTAAELARELDANRNDAHVVRTRKAR